MKKINWTSLLTNLALSVGTGALAALFTRGSMEQYELMYKPPLSPPGWLFPIVWTILYIAMGIAAYLVCETETSKSMSSNYFQENKKTALITYYIQLFVNFTWSIIFFNLKYYWLAFAWILLLWYLIYLTIRRFYEINKTAGIILVPYLLWVTFATYLTLAIAIGT